MILNARKVFQFLLGLHIYYIFHMLNIFVSNSSMIIINNDNHSPVCPNTGHRIKSQGGKRVLLRDVCVCKSENPSSFLSARSPCHAQIRNRSYQEDERIPFAEICSLGQSVHCYPAFSTTAEWTAPHTQRISTRFGLREQRSSAPIGCILLQICIQSRCQPIKRDSAASGTARWEAPNADYNTRARVRVTARVCSLRLSF